MLHALLFTSSAVLFIAELFLTQLFCGFTPQTGATPLMDCTIDTALLASPTRAFNLNSPGLPETGINPGKPYCSLNHTVKIKATLLEYIMSPDFLLGHFLHLPACPAWLCNREKLPGPEEASDFFFKQNNF